MGNPIVSLIVTTYNWPEALGLVLASVARQSRPPDEVVVADDGSGRETAEAIRRILGKSGLVWRHVRHEDSGVRQSRIKNLAVRHTTGDYLIFLDHDTVPHPCFVEDHLRMRSPGAFLQGKRAFLPKGLTQKVLKSGTLHPPSVLTPGLGNRKNALRWPGLGRRLAWSKRFQRTLRGCNLSMSREDFLRVDGFDEIFDSVWGREDSDICYRLFYNGVRCRNLWFMALQFHLDHPTRKNRIMDAPLDRVFTEKRKRSLKGFSQLSSEGGVFQESGG